MQVPQVVQLLIVTNLSESLKSSQINRMFVLFYFAGPITLNPVRLRLWNKFN